MGRIVGKMDGFEGGLIDEELMSVEEEFKKVKGFMMEMEIVRIEGK